MKDPKDVVDFYLQRIAQASHAVEKRIIKDDLFLYYYHLTASECEAVKAQMQPLLDEKQIEIEAKDPVLKRTGELLRKLKHKQAAISE